MQFCHWEDAYSDAIYGTSRQALPCPTGSNCWGEDYIDVGGSGLRLRGGSYCRDIYDWPTCSLVTDQLFADPGRTCGTLVAEGRCVVPDLPAGRTLGQLVGVCESGSPPTPGLTAWDPCDPLLHQCPAGSVCAAEDYFGPGTGQTRCLPYCDTAHHDGVTATCFDLHIEATEVGGATPVCTSLSATYEPLDIEPTRLGYCALPPVAP